jgi:hypothetical protein
VCVVNVAFEFGQHPQVSGPLVSAPRAALGPGPVTRLRANYFLHGTFDVGDIVPAILGGLAAALVVRTIEEKQHAQFDSGMVVGGEFAPAGGDLRRRLGRHRRQR